MPSYIRGRTSDFQYPQTIAQGLPRDLVKVYSASARRSKGWGMCNM